MMITNNRLSNLAPSMIYEYLTFPLLLLMTEQLLFPDNEA